MPQEIENGLDLREQFLRTVFRKMLGPSIKQAKPGQEVTAGAIVKQLGNIYFGTGKCVLVESHGMSAEFDKLSDGIHQMAGYPQNYAWNEAAKACQPGWLDEQAVFHPLAVSVPDTADR